MAQPNKSTTVVEKDLRPYTPPRIPSTVTFDNGSGATIKLGSLEKTVTDVVVMWGAEKAYDTTKYDDSYLTHIPVTALSLRRYSLAVILMYSGSTSPTVYSEEYEVRRNHPASIDLRRKHQGRP